MVNHIFRVTNSQSQDQGIKVTFREYRRPSALIPDKLLSSYYQNHVPETQTPLCISFQGNQHC